MANELKMIMVEAIIHYDRQDCPAARSQDVLGSIGRQFLGTSFCAVNRFQNRPAR